MNLHLIAIEIIKVKMNISPGIIYNIFDFSEDSDYLLRCGNWLGR